MEPKIDEVELYNKELTAQRLAELRYEYEDKYNDGKPISALQLVKRIQEKTRIKLGGNTLNHHENFKNTKTMSLAIVVALSKFYGVSSDYILGFSDSKYPEREDIQLKYGLSDSAMNRLENIKILDKRQQKEEPTLPTDLDIVNALFESGEFQDWVSLIRKSVIQRARSGGITDISSIKKRDQLIKNLSDEQLEICKDSALTVLAANETRQFLNFQLQQTTLTIVQDILNSL